MRHCAPVDARCCIRVVIMKSIFNMAKRHSTPRRLVRTLVAILLATASAASAQSRDEIERRIERLQQESDHLRRELESDSERTQEAERRSGILARELARLREAVVLPDSATLEGKYGFAPAASKVYHNRPGLSLGGYGEVAFAAPLADDNGTTDTVDFTRFVLYTGFKFNDWIVFNSELEVEHATTASSVTGDGGVVSLELANLDILLHPKINLRGGLLLVPMGFVNEVHEPPFFHGNARPLVETEILPSTWRANGAGIFGELLPGLEYRTYALTGFVAKRYRPEGLRLAKQGGSREIAEDWAWVLRLDYEAAFGLDVGGSLYLGDAGQGKGYGNDTEGFVEADVFTQIYEAHAELRRFGFEFRLLGAVALIDDAGALNSDPEVLGYDPTLEPDPDAPRPEGGVSEVLWGAYGEAAYDVLPVVLRDTRQYLAPWVRYSQFDTQASVPRVAAAGNLDREAIAFGLTYKPVPQVVVKLDYRILTAAHGGAPDELRLGGGFVF